MPMRVFTFLFKKNLEDFLVTSILRQPGFHRVVGRIHRVVDEFRHGPHPNTPPRQGLATEDPNTPTSSGFLRLFKDELINQLRGTPTDPPPVSRRPPRK